MRTPDEVAGVLGLAASGLGPSAIAARTGIPRGTVRDWLRGDTPRLRSLHGPLPPQPYTYLLGLYLGDGFIASGPRAYALRIFFDARYPGLIGECVRAMRAVMPTNRVHVARRLPSQCVVVQSWSQRWPEVFPQHGPGRKHERKIALTEWQRLMTVSYPQALVRGLLHSDGCRTMNHVGSGHRYAYPDTCLRTDRTTSNQSSASTSTCSASRGAARATGTSRSRDARRWPLSMPS